MSNHQWSSEGSVKYCDSSAASVTGLLISGHSVSIYTSLYHAKRKADQNVVNSTVNCVGMRTGRAERVLRANSSRTCHLSVAAGSCTIEAVSGTDNFGLE